MALRQKLQLRLGAMQPTLAGQAAGTDSDFRLNDVVAGAERIAFRIEQHHHAVALIAVHQEEPQHRNKGRQH
ncbi:hypothetical protein D3C79_1014640 [compost metagenome]